MISKKNYCLHNITKKNGFGPGLFHKQRRHFVDGDPTVTSPTLRGKAKTFVQIGQKVVQKSKNYRVSENSPNKKEITQNLNSFLNNNQYSFLENRRRLENKKIQTRFRSIISDQKKRATFAKSELKTVVLKTLLTVNHKVLNKSFGKALNKSFGKLAIKKSKYQKPQIYNKYPIGGPVLFLEKSIHPLFTQKTKSFSRIRNRCLLTGRSTIIGKYRLSRICFRQYAGSGAIPGVIKNRN